MGYPQEIVITVYNTSNREVLLEKKLPVTSYSNTSGVGRTLMQNEQSFNVSYTMWIIRVLYNGRTEPVWSQPSQEFFAELSGM